MTEKNKFFIHGKSFDTQQEMLEYADKWHDMPLDLNDYRKFIDQRYREAETNINVSGDKFTNRNAYYLLRAYTQWTVL